MVEWQADLRVLAEVAIAMGLGGAIGAERELADKPAGFRTLMLVAGVSALLVHLGQLLVVDFDPDRQIRADPVRVIQAIVVGISFLGAGTIFRSENGAVEGLTTAAAVLFASAIGMAVGIDHWLLAVGATALVLLALTGLRLVERGLRRRAEHTPPRSR